MSAPVASQTPPTPIPVTILTGFLGAGKTTLLKRILSEPHGERIAVIENEFGEESIDNELLFEDTKERIVEMNNGCICCTVRGDLIEMLGSLWERRRSGAIQFDRVIIETTGLAEPGPVAQTFFVDDDVAERYMLDAVITIVDARHGPDQLTQHAEAQAQVGFADRILISKSDLVDQAAVDTLRSRLLRMNARAGVDLVHFGQTPLQQILDIRGFNLNAALEIDPAFLDAEAGHSHIDDVHSFVFKSTRPFDSDRFEGFMSAVSQAYGPQLLRYKGVLWIKGSDNQMVFQGVHMLMGGDVGRPWQQGEARQSKLVFIGRKLPRDTIIRGLEQCLV
ncbi:MAG: GTP-binding protein [Burkholderiaceae bacterium]|nr:GTP-binding protein [Burkholderiaceae bacterium]